MSPEALIGLAAAVGVALAGIAAIFGWRSGARAMPVPSAAAATARTGAVANERNRVARAQRENNERAQELRNAATTPDADLRSDKLARIGNRRGGL